MKHGASNLLSRLCDQLEQPIQIVNMRKRNAFLKQYCFHRLFRRLLCVEAKLFEVDARVCRLGVL